MDLNEQILKDLANKNLFFRKYLEEKAQYNPRLKFIMEFSVKKPFKKETLKEWENSKADKIADKKAVEKINKARAKKKK